MKSTSIVYTILILALVSFAPTKPINNTDLLEKIYTQTDRPLYFPGETIWFKSYITNGENKITTISDVMYAQLISPKGTVAKTILLSVDQGYAYGDFQINKDWAGGIYKLRTYTNWMKNFGEESFFEKEIIVQKTINPNLLMTLEFDKEAYGKGSNVIGSFEVKDLENNPLSNTIVQYAVFIKGGKHKTGNATTDKMGKTNINFALPNDLNTTDALLNIIIPYKNNAESISRSIPVTLDKIDLQFFPESGSSILDIENKIAFKAINEFGKPVDVSGEIIDSLGTVKATFDSYHDGMGSFNFIPKQTSYYAKITAPFKSDSLIKIPVAKKIGTKFTIRKENDDYLANIFSNEDRLIEISISNTSKEFKKERIYLKNNKGTYRIKSKELPTGIIKISISNSKGDTVAERLLFVNKSNQLKINVSLDKDVYSSRDKVKVNIKTTDQNDKPIPANLSVSITDNRLVSLADDKQDNILSYLLMSSELRGKIHEPIFYFDKKEEMADKALDYVMLTHGWRKYIYDDKVTLKNASFLPDKRTLQTGKIVDKDYKPVKSHLLLFDQYTNKVLKFDSDSNGKYSFKIDHSNSNYVLLAYTNDGKKLKILKDKIKPGTINKNSKTASDSIIRSDFKSLDIENPMDKIIKEDVIPKSNLGLQLSGDNSLDEVVVIGYAVQSKRELSGAVSEVVSEGISTISSDNIGQLLQGRVAGISITNNSSLPGNSSAISIRGASSLNGNSQPLIVVDGVPMDQNAVNKGILNNLESSNIDNIHVLKGAAASAIYGSNGINGVIIISTKNQNFQQHYGYKSLNNKKYRNYALETFYSYSKVSTYNSREFYIPIYDNKLESSKRNDFRPTIYWNPIVQTDENGEATFEYYNSDALTSFIITTEGIGYNGFVGRDETTYSTTKSLNIECKTPPYLVLNDTINLPVVISNNTPNLISTSLKIQLPDELKLLDEREELILNIKAKSHITKTLKVTPIKTSDEALIALKINGKEFEDAIENKISIISPYFTTEASISGFKNESYEFETNNVVEGSLHAELTVYIDIVGDVMDGIESLIRQPYGCFEQVSSATYPNVLILKYLKETNKSNPEIEKRAMDYIQNGYKKLAAYETKENGFEWYGHTPPHEALSAYGLMEFMEMKEVYNGVSESMIERTINFLLRRRDGKGGFKQNRGKYGFSGAPEDVNNAYIVYAISESGLKVDIEKEYNNAFNDALKSNDSYKLALMASASLNFNKEENAIIIMNRIKENIENYTFKALPVKNTITYSYGNSKHIETASFTILALLKENKSPFLVSKGIEYLISERKNGRFGSTQATSMALKALIEYTKVQKQKVVDQNELIEVTINGKRINKKLKMTDDGKIVIDDLDDLITRGKQNITVNFSNPENTFPYLLNVAWDSRIPNSSRECKVELRTDIIDTDYTVGDLVRMKISVKNITSSALPMVTAIVGIPAGTSLQAWQLKEIIEKNKADYFEIFDNYLVLYWKEFNTSEIKELQLDLKAEIPGNYQAPASTVYLYYSDEYKNWIKGNKLIIK